MPTIINNNTWYYLPIVTSTSNLGAGFYNDTFKNAETLLNTSSIYTKDSREQVIYNTSNYIVIPNNNYGLVCGTRVLSTINGYFDINIVSSSGVNIDCYYTANTNSSLNTTYININIVPNINSLTRINMDAQKEYSIILVQQNTYINSSLFINTSGSIYPINSAFNGTILNNKFSY